MEARPSRSPASNFRTKAGYNVDVEKVLRPRKTGR
jgi:hypothetical protein